MQPSEASSCQQNRRTNGTQCGRRPTICNARARSAIGQVYILTGDSDLEAQLSAVRHAIGEFNHAKTEAKLKSGQHKTYEQLKRALETARSHLTS